MNDAYNSQEDNNIVLLIETAGFDCYAASCSSKL